MTPSFSGLGHQTLTLETGVRLPSGSPKNNSVAVVLTFWAGWCSPCIEELPYLQNLKAQFLKQNVEFLAVNIDNDSSMRRDMVASFRYQSAPLLTFALGDLEMRKAFGSTEIPYTCIIDQNGQIRYERKGLGADFSVAMAHQLQWVIGMNKAQ